MHLLRGDSHQPESLEKVQALLGDRKVDFMPIGGDHDYEGVKQDFGMYASLVAPGGYIAFHDIVYAPGVKRLWGEIKGGFAETREFISPKPKIYGIGLVRVPAA